MRVGLFLQSLDEEYQINVFRGIRDRALDRGIDLVCVQGEILGRGTPIRPFALAHQIAFDGLLILSSVVVGPRGSSRLIPSLLPPVPAVSIGLSVPGMTSLTIRSSHSMRALMDHLVDHGHRRFLYVGGPPAHPDNRLRQRIFEESLRAAGNRWPTIEWTLDHGGFFEASGMSVIRRHLDGPAFDVVVAANDNMALGVQRVLSAHPDPAWRRCGVTGYDDVPQAVVSSPPLTTVHTPIERLGALAFDRLMDLLEGRPTPRTQTIASHLVVRGSCGCRVTDPGVAPPPSAETYDQVRRQVLEAEQWLREGNDFGRGMGGCFDRTSLAELLETFLTVLRVRHFFLVIEGQLWYERIAGRQTTLDGNPFLDAPGLFARTEAIGAPRDLCVHHLSSEDQPLGLAVYSVDDNSLPHLTAALPHVAHAAHRILRRRAQEDQNRVLADLVRARTADLTEANRSLQEEVVRRRAAEEEVLQVSEFERQRFGLDLHDDICQRLAGVHFYLRSVAADPPADIKPVLEDLGGLVEETLGLTRQYSHASFPIDLEARGLDAVLRSLCETVARQKGVACEYHSDRRLERAHMGGLPALHLFRIVQEALQNAIKHSHARRLEVTLGWNRGRVRLRVTDDGVGLPRHRTGLEGFGLRSMAYRAAQLGAKLEFSSRPGEGTVVQVVVPGSVLFDQYRFE